MAVKCSQCGFENPDGFSFCGRCGTRLDADGAVPSIDEQQATIQQFKEAGDAAKRDAETAVALERYQQALALLDSAIMASNATLHVQLVKQRFDILAERYPLWPSAGQPERVEPDLQEMLALARRAGDGSRLSTAITVLARFYLSDGRSELARPLLEEAISLLRTRSDRTGEAAALADLARVNWRTGRFEGVPDALQRAHELRRHVGEPDGLARSYFDLGLLYRDGLSQPFHAVSHFEKSLEFARLTGNVELETRSLIGMGVSWTRLGDALRARATLEQAQHKAAEIRSAEQMAWLLVAQVDALRESGSAEAGSLSQRAVSAATEQRSPDLEWSALASHVLIGQAAGGWHHTLAALERMQELEQGGRLHAYCAIWSNALLARTQLRTGRPGPAGEASMQAISALQAHGHAGVPLPQAILWMRFEVLSSANDPSAAHYLRQAREAMLMQANTIGDGALRAHFLRDVSINRAIGDDWARIHT